MMYPLQSKVTSSVCPDRDFVDLNADTILSLEPPAQSEGDTDITVLCRFDRAKITSTPLSTKCANTGQLQSIES